jgi:hypothetical protein
MAAALGISGGVIKFPFTPAVLPIVLYQNHFIQTQIRVQREKFMPVSFMIPNGQAK